MKPGKSNAPKASVNDDLEFSSTPTDSSSHDEKPVAESITSTDSDDEYDSLFSNL
jgi:hypothetical protein